MISKILILICLQKFDIIIALSEIIMTVTEAIAILKQLPPNKVVKLVFPNSNENTNSNPSNSNSHYYGPYN